MAINYAAQYAAFVDEAYTRLSVTRLLETGKEKYKPLGANQILINNITMDGAYDYSRATGWATGGVDNTWDAYTLAMDRGIKLPIDAMDSDEAHLEAAKISAMYVKEKLMPELDAYRFSKIYADEVILGGDIVSANLTYDTAVAAIDTATAEMDDAEVPEDGRILFVSNEMYQLMKQSGEFYNTRIATSNNTTLNREITTFDNMPLVRVPSSRFKTAYTFGAGSFTPTVGAKAINFMMMDPAAAVAIIKHSQAKIFAPGTHTESDGYLITNRAYHGLNVLVKKYKGIYIHHKL